MRQEEVNSMTAWRWRCELGELTDGDGDVPAQGEAHQPLGLFGHDDWETIVAGFVDDSLQLLHCQVVLRQHGQRWVASPWPHHLPGQRGVRELLLGVQEGVAVEADVRLVDTLSAEGVAHPLAGHDGGHERDNVLQTAGQLEDDDHQGNSHPGHAAWEGSVGGILCYCLMSLVWEGFQLPRSSVSAVIHQ